MRRHKLDGIGVGRIRTILLLLILFTTPFAHNPLFESEAEAEAEEPTNRKAGNRALIVIG